MSIVYLSNGCVCYVSARKVALACRRQFQAETVAVAFRQILWERTESITFSSPLTNYQLWMVNRASVGSQFIRRTTINHQKQSRKRTTMKLKHKRIEEAHSSINLGKGQV